MRLTQTNKLLIVLCFTFTGITVFARSAFGAFSIEPAIISVRVDRGENTAWLDVVHTGGGPIAVNLTVFERNLTLEGNVVLESLVPSTDFIVHPTQIILQPGEAARVQATFKGETRGRNVVDKAYMLFSQEISLTRMEFDEEVGGVQTGIETLMQYYTVLAINTNSPGRLTFVSSRQLGNGRIEVIAANRSRGRVPIEKVGIMIGNERISNIGGGNNSIMPGQQRRFEFEFPRAVTARDVKFIQ